MKRKSKRFKLAIWVFITYTVVGSVAFYIYPEHITNFATFLGSTSLPVIGYIFGESWRPSKEGGNNVHDKNAGFDAGNADSGV